MNLCNYTDIRSHNPGHYAQLSHESKLMYGTIAAQSG